MRMLTHILAALLAIAVWSCGGRRDTRLERVDALVCADPEAALSVLDSINPDALTDPDRAWFALLRAKAADKSYRYIENDYLIGFAADYFAGRGDSLEIQALYYRGYGLSRNNQLEEALVALIEAYEKAEDADEYFYAGMSAREMTAVCVRLMMTREQLKYARLAKHRFEMAGKPEHSMWMDETILSSLILNREYDEASQLVSDIEADTAINNPDFRLEIEADKALLAFDLAKFSEAKDILTALQRNGYPLTANDMYRIADAALRLGESDSAEYYFEEAADLSHAREDSLYRMVMGARIAAQKGEYHNAYGISQELVKCVMLGDESLLTSPGNSRLLDDLRIKHEKSKAEARYHHVMIIALGAGSMLLMLLIGTLYLYMRMRLKAKRLEVEMFMQDAARLRDELSLSEDKQKSASLMAETMIETQARLSERIRVDLKELFSRHTALLNTLCQAYYVSR
ncbi:MAG: hypothetical protein K2J18_07670, partial [Paramuribaculum sp.]|nr:hypothetical protein [Paramuribaculum sp.]